MRLLIAFTLSLSPLAALPASATGGCDDEIGVVIAAMECETPAVEAGIDVSAAGSGERFRYEFDARCKKGDECVRSERICRTDSGEVGAWYVFIRVEITTRERMTMGIVCLTPSDERGLAVITPGMVRREFERLSWPTAELEIQPPDGQTLVNFDTNFFTDNTRPTTRTITLLGQRVTIEATPTSYTWRFGDGDSRTTTSPGAAYPALDVTHRYADTGRLNPSVDTTYQGRYRVNDDGWQTIPGSLTVSGRSVALQVRSATPHLVGSYRD